MNHKLQLSVKVKQKSGLAEHYDTNYNCILDSSYA